MQAPTAAEPASRPRVATLGTVAAARVRGTPRLLAGLSGVLALLCALAGGVGGLTAYNSATALSRAQTDTEQVVRAQTIAGDLLRTDATAATAFLVAGAESPEQRETFSQALGSASTLSSRAAAGQPADGEALARLSEQIVVYAELVEHARADNRQGLTVGKRYQQLASDHLRVQALPLVGAVIDANEQRLGVHGGGEISWPQRQVWALTATLVPVLVLLVIFSVWLARRTHRYVNPGVGLALVLLAASGVAGIAVQAGVALELSTFRDGAYASASRLAQARTLVYELRASESLALIARSSTGDEREWDQTYARLHTILDSEQVALQQAQAYQGVHTEIIRLEAASGDYDAAVALAVDPDRSKFEPLAAAVDEAAGEAADAALSELTGGRRLMALAFVQPVAGLVAAWQLLRGVQARIREYL
ncbi:MAG: hypothetical protein ACK5MT_13995 [Actinomycetales bacterium]